MTQPSSTAMDLHHDVTAALEQGRPIRDRNKVQKPRPAHRSQDRRIPRSPRSPHRQASRDRPSALVKNGTAEPVTMGSRTMREWVAIPAKPSPETTRDAWTALTGEALRHVRE